VPVTSKKTVLDDRKRLKSTPLQQTGITGAVSPMSITLPQRNDLVSKIDSSCSLEKQLESFTLNLNALKFQRSLQIKQLHQLLLMEIDLEDTCFIDVDRISHVDDDEYNQFMTNENIDNSFPPNPQEFDENENSSHNSFLNTRTSHRSKPSLQELLTELQTERARIESGSSVRNSNVSHSKKVISSSNQALDELLGY